jgi:hypothetical protein
MGPLNKNGRLEGTVANMCILPCFLPPIYYTVSYFYRSSEPDNPLA